MTITAISNILEGKHMWKRVPSGQVSFCVWCNQVRSIPVGKCNGLEIVWRE